LVVKRIVEEMGATALLIRELLPPTARERAIK